LSSQQQKGNETNGKGAGNFMGSVAGEINRMEKEYRGKISNECGRFVGGGLLKFESQERREKGGVRPGGVASSRSFDEINAEGGTGRRKGFE